MDLIKIKISCLETMDGGLTDQVLKIVESERIPIASVYDKLLIKRCHLSK